MMDKGIWLIDASPLAIARAGPNNSRPRNLVATIVRQCWETYTRDLIARAKPERVIVIGKAVHDILEGDNFTGPKLLSQTLPDAHLHSIRQPRYGWSVEECFQFHNWCSDS
jgi:hypothetical protein